MTGAANMALDHALMGRARRTGERVLRVYAWSEPTLSIGRHQIARGRINPQAAQELGVALVRRPTGGRALLHHREVTYSITTALAPDDSVRAWYGVINEILLRGLGLLDVPATVAPPAGKMLSPSTAACFVQPDEGEIMVDGRKLVGSALVRERDALLQHGSILLGDDQPLLESLLPEGPVRFRRSKTLRNRCSPHCEPGAKSKLPYWKSIQNCRRNPDGGSEFIEVRSGHSGNRRQETGDRNGVPSALFSVSYLPSPVDIFQQHQNAPNQALRLA
jgi:lipoate-protein ligase A